MSDYADINREFQAYQDRIADLEARIEALEAALQTADDALSMVQSAGVKRVPHGMDLNNVRAIIARAARAALAPRVRMV